MPIYPSAFTNQQIADQLTRGSAHWNATSLTYSFNDFSTSGNSLNATHILWIEKAITQIEDLFGLNLTQVASNGTITFNGTRGQGTYADLRWSTPTVALTDADIKFDQSWDTNDASSYNYGSYGFMTIMHEFLHALGLDHPGDYITPPGGRVTYFPHAELLQDTHRYTVMSYFSADDDGSGTSHWFYNGSTFEWKYAQTPMVYDILAMTDGAFGGNFGGYSANLTTRNTNTTYGYNATAGINEVFNFTTNVSPIVTLYDTGGTDTLDMSGDTVSQTRVITYDAAGVTIETDVARNSTVIDLREGGYSSTHGMTNNIGIAFGSVIENAIGTIFNDTIIGNDVANSLSGGGGNDTINGGLGGDILDGGAGVDQLNGGDGDDAFFGGTGADAINGGAGINDIAYYLTSTAAVTLNLTTNVNSGGEAQGDTLTGVEHLYGSIYGDGITGDGAANVMFGYSGNDTLNGQGGADLLYGGENDDTLNGGSEADVLDGSNGTDQLNGGDGDDAMFGGLGADVIDGGTGAGDLAYYINSTAAVTVNLTNNANSGGEAQGDTLYNIEHLFGSALGDILTGNASANTMFGHTGNDTLNGLAGADLLLGGDGTDTLNGGTENDILYGEAGADQLNGDIGEDIFLGGDGGDTINGGAGGHDIAYYVTSSAWVNVNLSSNFNVNGDAQGDVLTGVEHVFGSNFGDTIVGDGNINALYGHTGNDNLYGLGGSDYLYGGGNNDLLNGGAGADTLHGGANNDTFRFTDLDASTDTILDFEDGGDLISIATSMETSFAGLTITGNGTSAVWVTGFDLGSYAILVQGAGPITLSAADFLFQS